MVILCADSFEQLGASEMVRTRRVKEGEASPAINTSAKIRTALGYQGNFSVLLREVTTGRKNARTSQGRSSKQDG